MPHRTETAKRTGAAGGVCRYCGCTEDWACDGGCGWADQAETICSSDECLQRATKDGFLKPLALIAALRIIAAGKTDNSRPLSLKDNRQLAVAALKKGGMGWRSK